MKRPILVLLAAAILNIGVVGSTPARAAAPGVTASTVTPAHHHGPEPQGARAAPHRGHLRGDLQQVAGPDRGHELHVGVRREQTLVAVGADAHLRRHVPEQAQEVRSVDQVTGVVRVAVRHVPPVGHRQPLAHPPPTSACTR